MNNKANLYLALGLLPLLRKRGSLNSSTPAVPLRLVGSTPTLKDSKATADRWMSRLSVPKDQKLVRQKELRELPIDAKGRISRESVLDLYSQPLPYTLGALSEPLESVLLAKQSNFVKALRSGRRLIKPNFLTQYEEKEHSLTGRYATFLEKIASDTGNVVYSYNSRADTPSDTTILLPPFIRFINVRQRDTAFLREDFGVLLNQLFGVNLYTRTGEKLPISNLEMMYRLDLFGSTATVQVWKSGIKPAAISKFLKLLWTVAPTYHWVTSPFLKEATQITSKQRQLQNQSEIVKKITTVLSRPSSGTYAYGVPRRVQERVLYGQYGLGSILNLKKTFKGVPFRQMSSVECLLYPNLNRMVTKRGPSGFGLGTYSEDLGRGLATHFISVDGAEYRPLFWFRGLIVNDTLYIQELQNDHAQFLRRNNDNNWSREYGGVDDIQSENTKAPNFKFDRSYEETFSYERITPSDWSDDEKRPSSGYGSGQGEFEAYVDRQLEEMEDEAQLSPDKYPELLTPQGKSEMRERFLREGITRYDNPKMEMPPTDWVRSDILMAFSFASALGLKSVGFCTGAVSVATVGGELKGQRSFYDEIVPQRVKSVAKKYGITPLRNKRLYVTKDAEKNYIEKTQGKALGGYQGNAKDFSATLWDLGSAREFFRRNGYPLFG